MKESDLSLLEIEILQFELEKRSSELRKNAIIIKSDARTSGGW